MKVISIIILLSILTCSLLDLFLIPTTPVVALEGCDIPPLVLIDSPRDKCVVWSEIKKAKEDADYRMMLYDMLSGGKYEGQSLGDTPILFIDMSGLFLVPHTSTLVVGVFDRGPDLRTTSIMWASNLEPQYHSLSHEIGHYIWYRRYGLYPFIETWWREVGHGTAGDPYIFLTNNLIDFFINIPEPKQPYHPQHIGRVVDNETTDNNIDCILLPLEEGEER